MIQRWWDFFRRVMGGFARRRELEWRRARLRQAAGMWRDRTDLPDWTVVRRSADRDFVVDREV